MISSDTFADIINQNYMVMKLELQSDKSCDGSKTPWLFIRRMFFSH